MDLAFKGKLKKNIKDYGIIEDMQDDSSFDSNSDFSMPVRKSNEDESMSLENIGMLMNPLANKEKQK